MKKALAALLILSFALCSGCKARGGIYTNYRDIAELLVVQTMGLDADKGGITVSVSAGSDEEDEKTVCISASGETLTEAQEKLQNKCGGKILFFGHVSYIVLGDGLLQSGISRCLRSVERDAALRLCIPVVAVSGGSAQSIIENDENDVTRLLGALKEDQRRRGDIRLFTLAETIASIDLNGSALMFSVKSDDNNLLPDGYEIIKDGAAIGRISPDAALGAGIILGDTGSVPVSVGGSTLQIDKSKCDISPIFSGSKLRGINFSVKLDASVLESDGESSPEELEKSLEHEVRRRIDEVMASEINSGCDFLHLGSSVEMKRPITLHGYCEDFYKSLGSIAYSVEVSAKLDRSFHLDMQEARP